MTLFIDCHMIVVDWTSSLENDHGDLLLQYKEPIAGAFVKTEN